MQVNSPKLNLYNIKMNLIYKIASKLSISLHMFLKNVLNFALKLFMLSVFLISAGRLFHSLIPDTVKVLPPSQVR